MLACCIMLYFLRCTEKPRLCIRTVSTRLRQSGIPIQNCLAGGTCICSPSPLAAKFRNEAYETFIPVCPKLLGRSEILYLVFAKLNHHVKFRFHLPENLLGCLVMQRRVKQAQLATCIANQLCIDRLLVEQTSAVQRRLMLCTNICNCERRTCVQL